MSDDFLQQYIKHMESEIEWFKARNIELETKLEEANKRIIELEAGKDWSEVFWRSMYQSDRNTSRK